MYFPTVSRDSPVPEAIRRRAGGRQPAADHFRNVHSLHLLVGHNHTSPQSAAMVSYQALQVAYDSVTC